MARGANGTARTEYAACLKVRAGALERRLISWTAFRHA